MGAYLLWLNIASMILKYLQPAVNLKKGCKLHVVLISYQHEGKSNANLCIFIDKSLAALILLT